MTNSKKTSGSQRIRTKYSPEQLRTLETVFSETQYPDSEMLEDLAMKMDIATDKISIWFQNRRSKFKRQSKDSHVTWMRKQIFQQQQPLSYHPYHVMPASSDVKQTTCHVLSAPETQQDQSRQTVGQRPSSNIHYIPGPSVHDLSAGSPTCSVISRTPSPSSGDSSTSTHSPNNTSAPNGSFTPSPNSSQNSVMDLNNLAQRSLLFSHLPNDQQSYTGMPTGYSWNGQYYGQSMYAQSYATGPFYPAPSATPYPSSYTPTLLGL